MINGLKNVAVLAAHVAAAVVFVIWASLDWSIVGLIAIAPCSGAGSGRTSAGGFRRPSSGFWSSLGLRRRRTPRWHRDDTMRATPP